MALDLEMQKALEADGEKLRQLTGQDHGPFPCCPDCEGNGWVRNPDARYYEEPGAPGYHTNVWSTNDPEEVTCPTCDGFGWLQPEREEYPGEVSDPHDLPSYEDIKF